jgi:hypothetical protein
MQSLLRFKLGLILKSLVLIFFSHQAWGFPVTIDPGAFSGQYRVNGSSTGSAFFSGVQNFDLSAGVYEVRLFQGSAIAFEVGSVGELVIMNPQASELVNGNLTFINIPLDVDPSSFDGEYRACGSDFFTSLQTFLYR